MAERCKFKTSVGGQAVMEGVMMQGPKKVCLAVRTPSGEIVTEVRDMDSKGAWRKIPIVRGVMAFFVSMANGYKQLMRSAELSMTEEELEDEESKFDRWVKKTFGDKASNFILILASVMGVGLALGLFMLLPTALVGLLGRFVTEIPVWAKSLLEGGVKIVIFIAYLAMVRLSPDIRRVFAYHGAEHKTIFCYEMGEELTVENVRKQIRFHPRCGTSFLVLVMIVSILIFSLVPWGSVWLRFGIRLLLLPLVMGISYELIRLAGRYDNIVTRIISAPGVLLQRLTTSEPEDDMIEVAIAAIKPVLPESPNEAKW